MSQLGFFDIANRYAGLDAKNDPLVKLDAVVPSATHLGRFPSPPGGCMAQAAQGS